MSELEFTGERFMPGQGGAQIAYEHLHRYAFAAPLARDKTVLDVACGSGFGTALLARKARRVIGFDIELSVIARSVADRAAGNLEFLVASAERMPLRSATVDLVTAFEVLEHVADPEALVRETARVVKPDGAVLISTPNKAVYSDAREYRNPFHVKEFYREELQELLQRHFGEVRLLAQQLRAGSAIGRDLQTAGCEAVLEPDPLPDPARPGTAPMYFLAACSPQPCGLQVLPVSIYLDPTDRMFQEWQERFDGILKELDRVNAELRRSGQWGRQLESEVHARDEALVKATRRFESEAAARDRIIRAQQRDMRFEIDRRDHEIDGLRGSLDERLRWVRALEAEVASRDERIREAYRLLDHTDNELKSVSRRLSTIRRSLLYRILRRLRLLPD